MATATLARTETRSGREQGAGRKPAAKVAMLRSKTRAAVAMRYLIASFLLVIALAYVAVYANFRMEGYTRSSLLEQRRQERLRGERLRVKLSGLNAPDVVVTAAEKDGMVCADKYEYLGGARQARVTNR